MRRQIALNSWEHIVVNVWVDILVMERIALVIILVYHRIYYLVYLDGWSLIVSYPLSLLYIPFPHLLWLSLTLTTLPHHNFTSPNLTATQLSLLHLNSPSYRISRSRTQSPQLSSASSPILSHLISSYLTSLQLSSQGPNGVKLRNW